MELRHGAENRHRERPTVGSSAASVSLVRDDKPAPASSSSRESRHADNAHYEIAIGRWKADLLTPADPGSEPVRIQPRGKRRKQKRWERRRMDRAGARIALRRAKGG